MNAKEAHRNIYFFFFNFNVVVRQYGFLSRSPFSVLTVLRATGVWCPGCRLSAELQRQSPTHRFLILISFSFLYLIKKKTETETEIRRVIS